MSNERLGIFEELQERRRKFEHVVELTRRRCIAVGPKTKDGPYAELRSPHAQVVLPQIRSLARKITELGGGEHKTRNYARRQRHPEADWGIGVERVIQAVALACGEHAELLFGFSKRRTYTLPRQLAMWCIDRYCPDYSLSQIGSLFHRDHTTVMHAIRVIDDRILSEHPTTVDLLAKARVHLEGA